MRSRCVVFHHSRYYMRPESAREWLEWFEFHGIESRDVRVGHPIVCHDTSCQISWTGRDGKRHHVQGEGPALPFPELDESDGFFGHEISETLVR